MRVLLGQLRKAALFPSPAQMGVWGLGGGLRVDIWRDRCDRRSCKILVSRVNFSENNANCVEILPKNKVLVLVLEFAAF